MGGKNFFQFRVKISGEEHPNPKILKNYADFQQLEKIVNE
jgi:hypothetical protein